MIRSALLPATLASPIAAYCIHLATRSLPTRHAPPALARSLPPLLTNTFTPLVAKAALLHRPEIDLDWATRRGDLGLLDLMVQWSKEPNGRPLNYTPQGVMCLALQQPRSDVLDWWVDRRHELMVAWQWHDPDILEAFCSKDRGTQWFEWWKARGLPYLDDRVTFPELVVHVSEQGRVDLLDWLLEHVGADRMVPETRLYSGVVSAARKGHVPVLDWWLRKTEEGIIHAQLNWTDALTQACEHSQVTVVDWCITQPSVLESVRQNVEANPEGCRVIRSVFEAATTHGFPHWLDAFDCSGLGTFEFSVASLEACRKGNLNAVKALHRQGRLIGTRLQLLQEAIPSGNLALLDWIQEQVDPVHAVPVSCCFREEHLYITASLARNINMFHWLADNLYPFPQGCDLAGTFVFAVLCGDVAVLDWLLQRGLLKDVEKEDWAKCFGYASSKGFVHVLDWLAANTPAEYHMDSPSSASSSPIQNPLLLTDSFANGKLDVVNWWLHKSGPFKTWFDLGHGHPYLYACKYGGADALSALQAWVMAGQPIDYAKCINEASVNGRTDVLDWLLHSARVSQDTFVQAWTSKAFPDEEQYYWDWWYDEENHGCSLVWWRENVPQVCGLPMNRGPLTNPIHAHYLKHMMGSTSFELLEPHLASDMESGGVVPILTYWRDHGDANKLEEDCDWCLGCASSSGYCHVLEWWKTQSGLKIKCPEDIVDGTSKITETTKQWWAQSGLVSEKQVAQMKTR